METALFLLAYTLSGFGGLVYEVAWTRWLSLAMGHGLAASSTVLAAFMGGLALGALVGGRLAVATTRRQALRFYALLELVVALLALALPFALRVLTPIFSTAYRDGSPGTLFGLVRLAACLALLLVPAAAMGATFPLAVRYLATGAGRSSWLAGWAYAANTAGAAVGSVLSGFVLVPMLGITGASRVGVVTSLGAMAVALVLASRTEDETHKVAALVDASHAPPASAVRTSKRTDRSRRSPKHAEQVIAPQPWLASVILATTGAVTFAYEITWMRVFALVVGPSTYAFAATIAAFIGGLAVGASAGAALVRHTKRLAVALAFVLGGAALAAAWASGSAGRALPERVMHDFATAPPGALLFAHVLLVAATIVPAAIGIGAAFPIALALASGTEARPRDVAIVYAVNTVSAVAGSLVTGFLAIPLLGLERTLDIATVLLIGGAAVALVASPGSLLPRVSAAVPAAAAAATLFLGTRWDRELLASGSYKYAAAIPPGLDIETALKAGTLVYYKDGATGTVSVKRLTGALSLAIDGKVDASSSGDMLTQKLLAHLPLLVHEDPHEVCIIGLGSGGTLASALTHPIRRVDVLEISPEVADASRLFARETPGQISPLDDPRTRLIVADGRTHLQLARQRYDVIVSEPSNPWMAGVAALFTREFFEEAKARLNARGILCQWVNTYDISTRDLQSIVATFSAVFPHGTMWLIGDGDLLLLGALEPIEPRLDGMARAWTRPGVADDLRAVAVADPFGVLSMFVGGDDAVSQFGDGAEVQVDDRMALEFTAPRALRTLERRENVLRLRELARSSRRPDVVSAAWAGADRDALTRRAVMLQQAGAFNAAYDAAADVIQQAPDASQALGALVECAVASDRQAEAVALLQKTIEAHPRLAAPRIALSRLHAATGAAPAAVQIAIEAAAIQPVDPAALEQLASVLADTGDADRLALVVEALARYPERAGSRYYAAALHFLRGDLPAAETAAGQAIALDAKLARAQNLLGAVQATRGDTRAARGAFEAALALDPHDAAAYRNLGLLELNSGNPTAASRLFAESLSLDPGSAPARAGLQRAREMIN